MFKFISKTIPLLLFLKSKGVFGHKHKHGDDKGYHGHRSCSTQDPTKEEQARDSAIMQEWKDMHFASFVASNTTTIIDTYIHIITPSQNEVTDDEEAQMNALNAAFAGSGFSFNLVETLKHDNDEWWTAGPSDEGSMKAATRRGDCKTLNIWYNNPNGTILGWATFASWCENNLGKDGVVVRHSATAGGSLGGYNGGKTLVHEVGHWLGLYHTFQGGCSGNGDHVDDTPAVSRPNFDCPVGIDSCPDDNLGPDMVENYMDYTIDSCMDSFTPGQVERMVAQWDSYRDIILPPTPAPTPLGPTTPPTPLPPSPAPTIFLCDDESESKLTVNLMTDDYAYEISWELVDALDNNALIGKGDEYKLKSTLHIHNFCVTPSCFALTIKDIWGDGICCLFGDGYYEVLLDGEVMATGGEYGCSETKHVCSPNLTIQPTPAPTPCVGSTHALTVNMKADYFSNVETDWRVIDTVNNDALIGESDCDTPFVLTTHEFCVAPSCFAFTINDSYGDGICCEWGDGYYEVLLDGEIMAAGGEFENTETKEFCSKFATPWFVSPVGSPDTIVDDAGQTHLIARYSAYNAEHKVTVYESNCQDVVSVFSEVSSSSVSGDSSSITIKADLTLDLSLLLEESNVYTDNEDGTGGTLNFCLEIALYEDSTFETQVVKHKTIYNSPVVLVDGRRLSSGKAGKKRKLFANKCSTN